MISIYVQKLYLNIWKAQRKLFCVSMKKLHIGKPFKDMRA